MNGSSSSLRSRIVAGVGLALVVAAYAGAILNTLRIKREEQWTDKKVIRICHWQLEAGYREALQWVIGEFEKRHPDTKVIQLNMHGRAYPQFVTTQLIGGTAPDVIQIGQFNYAMGNDLGRFYYPLGEDLSRPNPYNAGNELRDTPWLFTFKHLCEFNWNPQNLNYFSIGITGVSQRMTYNRELLIRILGSETPPQTYRELLAFCDTVRAYARRTGSPVWPIASSRDQGSDLSNKLATSLGRSIDESMSYERDFDLKIGSIGTVSGVEQFLSWLEGATDIDSPLDSVRQQLSRDVSQLFEPGFMGKLREDAMLSFIQQRAVMILTPSWDINSLVVQALSAGFSIGVIKYPRPDKDDPVYGRYVDLYSGDSRTDNNYPFGVSRMSKHPDVARNFLKFWSSRDIAQEFCKRAGLLCMIQNTENVDFMKPYEPDYRGLPPTDGKDYTGNQQRLFKRQIQWQYDAGTISYAEFRKKFQEGFPEYGLKDFVSALNSYRNNMVPANFTASNAALRLRTARTPEERERYLRILKYLTESASRSWTNLQGSTFEFLRATSADSPRVRAVKASSQYGPFMNTFPHTAGRNR